MQKALERSRGARRQGAPAASASMNGHADAYYVAPGAGRDAGAGRPGARRDLRADPLRDEVFRLRRGDRAAERRAAGPVVVDLHQRPARGRALPVGATARTAASPTSTSARRAPRSAARSAARRKPAAAARAGSDAWKAYMRRATNTVNYSQGAAAGAGRFLRHRLSERSIRTNGCRRTAGSRSGRWPEGRRLAAPCRPC